jgi:hypothetical protein
MIEFARTNARLNENPPGVRSLAMRFVRVNFFFLPVFGGGLTGLLGQRPGLIEWLGRPSLGSKTSIGSNFARKNSSNIACVAKASNPASIAK